MTKQTSLLHGSNSGRRSLHPPTTANAKAQLASATNSTSFVTTSLGSQRCDCRLHSEALSNLREQRNWAIRGVQHAWRESRRLETRIT